MSGSGSGPAGGSGASGASGAAVAHGAAPAGASRSHVGVTNVVVAGLGGQGVITASDILADAALRAGLDVKKAEVHGLSQRGGSVTSDVRFGEKVLSPMVPAGEADYLVVLAPSEVDVARGFLRPGGVLLGPELIPDEELPNKRSLNVALLGALSAYLAIPVECLVEAVRAALPERLHETNEHAFELGRRTALALEVSLGPQE